MAKRIGLVVPALATSGGVGSVAGFLMRTIKVLTDYDLTVVSLAMSARDPVSLCLTRPQTWVRGVTTTESTFQDVPFTHIGAEYGEIETQRYQPRDAVADALKDCDLIQVVCGTPAWAVPVLDLGKPVSLQVATLIEKEREARLASERGVMRIWRHWMTRQNAALEPDVLRKVAAIQVENQWMLNHMRGAAGASTDVRLACPGVDLELFKPTFSRGAEIPYILSVGRMQDPRKNHMLLLDAYRRLVAKMDAPPRLLLAGPDGPAPQFEHAARAAGIWDRIRIEIFPSAEKLAEFYRHASAFVLTSDEEGFGVAVIEAMASGIPTISTRSGGPDGIITHGQDGLLCDTGDAVALADCLASVLSNLDIADNLSRNARRTAKDNYSSDAAGKPFVDVFRKLLGDEAPTR